MGKNGFTVVCFDQLVISAWFIVLGKLLRAQVGSIEIFQDSFVMSAAKNRTLSSYLSVLSNKIFLFLQVQVLSFFCFQRD